MVQNEAGVFGIGRIAAYTDGGEWTTRRAPKRTRHTVIGRGALVAQRHTAKEGLILPCTWRRDSSCRDCEARGRLMCRPDRRDLFNFFVIILPFGVTTVSGLIRAAAFPRIGRARYAL